MTDEEVEPQTPVAPLGSSAVAASSSHQASRRRSSLVQAVEKVDDKLHAYEREPVPEDRYKGWLSFLGLFTSRHTAGTEFTIGPLFVANGATAIDVIVGLAIGNALATLSWRYVVAPLAVQKRFTAYYAMERVTGRRVVLVYDAVSCILLAGLAGAMFTVSATAFAVIFNVEPPELSALLPSNVGFVILCIVCGLVTTCVAAIGFSVVTMFGDLMTPILISGIIYLFVKSLQMLGIGENGCGLWCILTEEVFTGIVQPGQSKFGMAHCIFFAWFVDLQLHLGQNDLTLLRFAKNKHIGWASAGGMYIGHYFAWITAGCMYAVQLKYNPELNSVAPGPIASLVGGNFGLFIIIIAGWSTANPVIYSSGLALQHIFPRVKAWLSTIIVGLVATAASCFPALTNGIMVFLTFAGIILCPMGVMVFTDNVIFQRLGLQSELSYTLRPEEEGNECVKTNWPAVWTWLTVEVVSLPLALLTPVSSYFTPVITLVYSCVAYIGLTKFWVKKGWIVYDGVTSDALPKTDYGLKSHVAESMEEGS